MIKNGLLICFTGIDGSGKTTQAKLLVDWLNSQNINSMYIWSRGEVLTIRKFLLFLGRRALGTSTKKINQDINAHREYQTRKSRLMKSSIIRHLWSYITYIEHLFQINWVIRRKLQTGLVIVCDRYLWDSSIDMAILTDKDTRWLTSKQNGFLWRFVPRPAITFFVDISPEEALKRKDDIPSFDYVKTRTEFYRYLSQHNSFTVINGCAEPDLIHKEISNNVSNYIGGMEQL